MLRIEEERYQNDWLSALDMDELFKLRKAKAEAEELARAEAKAIADKSEFERLVAARLESERLTIEAEARRKAEAEYMAKIEAESAKIRAEEQAKINEERRLEQIKVDEKAKIDRADFDARCLRNKKELQDLIELAESRAKPSEQFIKPGSVFKRPSGEMLINDMAIFYDVSELVICEWLQEIDFAAYVEAA